MSGERRDCVSARVERARDRERLGERSPLGRHRALAATYGLGGLGR